MAVSRQSLAALLRPSSSMCFWLLVAMAIALRLHHIDHPPDDAYEWRQTQTLMNAASYARGVGWLTPQIDWYGATPRTGVLEFPLYSVVAYLVGKLSGSLLVGARVASLTFSVAAIVVFDRVGALRGHPRRRAATVLFALAPIAVFYGHSTQPESLLLLLIVCTAYSALRAKHGSTLWYLSAAICLALATVIKPTALLVLAPPLLFLGARRAPRRHVLLVLGVACGAAWVWNTFDRSVLLASAPDWYATSTRFDWLWGPLSLRLDSNFYLGLAATAARLLLPLFAVALVIWSAARRRGDAFWWWWLAGGLLSIEVFSRLNQVHAYYQLPLIPALAALAAYAVPAWPKRLLIGFSMAALVVVATVVPLQVLLTEYPVEYRAGRALAAATQPGRPVLVLTNSNARWFPSVLYYAGRTGWNLGPETDSASIRALPGEAVCDLVVVRDGPVPDQVPSGWSVTADTPDYRLAHRTGAPGCTLTR